MICNFRVLRFLIQMDHIVDKYVYLRHETRIGSHNQTYEVHRRSTLGWAAFGELKDIPESDILTTLKLEVYNQCVPQVLTYCAKILSLTKHIQRKLQVTQRSMEGSMFGLTLTCKVRNEQFCRRTDIEDVIQHIAKLKCN